MSIKLTKRFLPRHAALLAVAVVPLLGGVVTITGCGSGGSSSTGTTARSQKVSINIAWPAVPASSSRYLPPYAQSIFFELYATNNPDKRYNLIVNRPSTLPTTQTVTFSQILNEGDYVLAASARVQQDGQGATVASAAVPVTVRVGMGPVDLGLNSTIKTIQILGQPLTVPVGPAVQLQSGAFDPDGRTLLLPSSALTWSIVSGGRFGSLTAEGVLTPTAAGTIRVQLAEANTGVSAQADITLTAQQITVGLGNTPYPKELADLLNTGYTGGAICNGQLAWVYDLGTSSAFYTNSPILGGNGLVYATSQATANGISAHEVGVKAADGTRSFEVTLNATNPNSPVVLSNNLVCLPMNNTGVVALDAATGIERWRNSDVRAVGPATLDRSGNLLIPGSNGLYILNATTGTTIATFSGTNPSMPAVGQDGTVYYVRQVGSSSAQGELVAANPSTHQAIWTASEIEQGHSPVIGPNGAVYVIGSQAGTAFTRLVAFDPGTGTVRAELRNQFFSFSQDPVFGPDGLLYIGAGDKITAYSLDLTQVRQSPGLNSGGNFYNTRRVTIGRNGVLYVVADQNSPDADAFVLAYNTADLSERWRYQFTGRVLGSMALDSDGTLYFLTDTGKLTALR